MEIFRNLFGFILLLLFSISTLIGKGEHLPSTLLSEDITVTSAETIQDDFFGTIGDNVISNQQGHTLKRVKNHFSFSFLINTLQLKSVDDLQPYDALFHIDVYKDSLSIFNLVLRI